MLNVNLASGKSTSVLGVGGVESLDDSHFGEERPTSHPKKYNRILSPNKLKNKQQNKQEKISASECCSDDEGNAIQEEDGDDGLPHKRQSGLVQTVIHDVYFNVRLPDLVVYL